jgi:hypothetical protein
VLCRQCFKTKRAPNVATPETVSATAQLVAEASAAPPAPERNTAPAAAEVSVAAQPSQA